MLRLLLAVEAAGVGSGGTRLLGTDGNQGDFGARQDRAAGVGHLAGDRPGDALRLQSAARNSTEWFENSRSIAG